MFYVEQFTRVNLFYVEQKSAISRRKCGENVTKTRDFAAKVRQNMEKKVTVLYTEPTFDSQTQPEVDRDLVNAFSAASVGWETRRTFRTSLKKYIRIPVEFWGLTEVGYQLGDNVLKVRAVRWADGLLMWCYRESSSYGFFGMHTSGVGLTPKVLT